MIVNERIHKGPIFRGLISLAIPAVGSTLFIMIFEIVDMFWVGKLGNESVAALSTGSFFVWMVRAASLAIAVGSLALVSRRTGEKDRKKVLETSGYALISTVVFTVFMMLLLLPLSFNVFDWLGLDKTIAGLAEQYVQIFLGGIIFIYLMATCEHILRGAGNTVTPMIIAGFSLVLNILLDPIFIFKFNLGLKGAAYATVLSQFIGCILMLRAVMKFFKDDSFVKMKIYYRQLKHYFLSIIKIGLPVSLSEIMFSVIYLGITGIISSFGSETLSAMGIGHRIEAFPFFIALGFSRATSTMVGQNLGAGKPERAQASVMLSLRLVSGILLITSVVFYVLPEYLYGIFISDSRVIELGADYLRIIAIFEIFLAFEIILEGAFSGAGDTKPPFLIISSITLLRIPLSYLLGIVLKYGINGVWVVISFTTFFKGVLLYYWFKKGKWMKKKI